MSKRTFPTQARLHQLLERKYDSDGRLFFVAKVKRKTVKVGDILYGYPLVCNKGFTSEHVRYMLTIDNNTQTMAVFNYIYEYGNFNRDVETVDHEDQNPLNDHHSNLRLATRSQQLKNRGKYKKSGSSSNFHGVCFVKKTKKWIVQYTNKETGIQSYIGLYTDEKAAALAHDLVAWEAEKDVRSLNFPDQVGMLKEFDSYKSKYPDATILV